MIRILNSEEAARLFTGGEHELATRVAEVAWQQPAQISLEVNGSPGLLTQIDAENFTLEVASPLAGWR